jgi:O-antigen ligase
MIIRKNFYRSIQRFALCLYFFSIHFESWDLFSVGIDFLITKITIVFYILISIPNLKRVRFLNRFKRFIIPIILIFLIQTISGYNYKRVFFEEYFSLVIFLNIIVFLLMLLQAQIDNKAIFLGLKSFAFGGIVMALFFVLGIQTDNSFGGRTTIFDVNHNMLAVNLSIVILILLHQLLFNKKINGFFKFVYVPFIVVIIGFIASTGSRSGILSLLGGIFVMYLLMKSKNIIKRIMTLIIGSFVSFLAIFYFLTNSLVGDRFNETVKSGDISGRNDYWIEMIPFYEINPFFGIGHTGFLYEVESVYGEYRSAHNVFVTMLVTGGIISLFLLCFFLNKIIKKAIMNYRTKYDILSLILIVPIFVMAFVAHLLSTKIEWGIFAYIITLNCQNVNRIKYLKK